MNKSNIAHSVGMPEYSYYFVLKDFIPLLERVGAVHELSDPANEVDALHQQLTEAGERCLFLNFTAPQNMLADIHCPTFHVFAWEFNTLPTETWLGDGLQDWRVELRAHKAAITHSDYARRAIQDAMGADFPVAVIPCPVWDNFAAERAAIGKRTALKSDVIHFEGRIFDSRHIELFVDYDVFRERREAKIRAAQDAAVDHARRQERAQTRTENR